MMRIPFYLQKKLASLAIDNEQKIKNLGYLEVFAQLKAEDSSTTFGSLFDLYMICEQTTYPDQVRQKFLITQFKQLAKRYTPLAENLINYYLIQAENEAKLALNLEEVPIGAVIVYKGQIIGRGFNQTRSQKDILAHAEIQAICQAQNKRQNFRLNECDLYVTIEPCLMCSGAIINSRIRRLIYGAKEHKTGACVSQYQVFNNMEINHHCQVIGPINQAYYSQLINQFFLTK